ncbi:hypothetical protein SSYM_1134 [Serratia symbiotica str. Tucson]|uniref:Uncharacterized protein n=1 Tax=Serratia symbiotica str. Tucson TaxID=914128 RepID=E9CLL3_9GAMM|nr:hypothetical protein SSYM_1134 [Serratia symbiotica str. Tucson]
MFTFHILRRMHIRKYRLQRPDTHLRVDLRALHTPVTQHRLYSPQVRAVLQHLRRHCLPEQMATPFFSMPAALRYGTTAPVMPCAVRPAMPSIAKNSAYPYHLIPYR